jgi:amino acid transporter
LSLGWLNYYGVKLGGNVQVTVTVVKVALIAAIIVSGLLLGHAHAPAAGEPPGSEGLAPLTFRRLHRRPGGGAVGL